ncbi:MAG: Chaperone protein DnaJ [Cyanobacteriota bacterium]|jgi:hypothetical protein
MPAPTSRPETYYDRLGVRPTASPQQIRQAFRELSKLYHPDTTTLPAEEATEKFQLLNEAYGILSSPDRRWTYDKQVGYSRISVMQPLEPLSRASSTVPRRREPSNLYLDPTDRPLSAGEIFALFILGLTFVACLALVVTVGLTRGEYAINPVSVDATLVPAPAGDPRVAPVAPVTESHAGPLDWPRVAPDLPSSPHPTQGLPTWL